MASQLKDVATDAGFTPDGSRSTISVVESTADDRFGAKPLAHSTRLRPLEALICLTQSGPLLQPSAPIQTLDLRSGVVLFLAAEASRATPRCVEAQEGRLLRRATHMLLLSKLPNKVEQLCLIQRIVQRLVVAFRLRLEVRNHAA